ncbi:23S ribosomal RNA methyltransferase Erm [Microbacterium sp. KNMS]
MRPRSIHGGRHELGQNFLIHQPTIDRLVALVADTTGSVLEIGAGDGALTRRLATLPRDFTALEIDETRVRGLRRRLPGVRIVRADALGHPLDADVVVGNLPFHLTTPLLRHLLAARRWTDAVLLTQWEVARKRAGVGGATLMTAQAAPWFAFALHGRVPARGFRPVPGVDGGILTISRRPTPLVPTRERRGYERFVRSAFTGQGRGMAEILRRATGADGRSVRRALAACGIDAARLPRDLQPEDWAALWREVSRR